MGYAESKHVAERMLDEAARVSGMRSVVCSVGLVAGPKGGKGVWQTGEWVSELDQDWCVLGMFAVRIGPMERVDWIPIDVLVGCVGESSLGSDKDGEVSYPKRPDTETNTMPIADEQPLGREPMTRKENEHTSHLSKDTTTNLDSKQTEITIEAMTTTFTETADVPAASAKVYYLVNPSPTTYAAVLPFILSPLPSDLQAKLVSVNEWIAKLQSSDPTPESNPAIKLPHFFQGLFEMQKAGRKMVVLDTEETRRSSRLLRIDSWEGEGGVDGCVNRGVGLQ